MKYKISVTVEDKPGEAHAVRVFFTGAKGYRMPMGHAKVSKMGAIRVLENAIEQLKEAGFKDEDPSFP